MGRALRGDREKALVSYGVDTGLKNQSYGTKGCVIEKKVACRPTFRTYPPATRPCLDDAFHESDKVFSKFSFASDPRQGLLSGPALFGCNKGRHLRETNFAAHCTGEMSKTSYISRVIRERY